MKRVKSNEPPILRKTSGSVSLGPLIKVSESTYHVTSSKILDIEYVQLTPKEVKAHLM